MQGSRMDSKMPSQVATKVGFCLVQYCSECQGMLGVTFVVYSFWTALPMLQYSPLALAEGWTNVVKRS